MYNGHVGEDVRISNNVVIKHPELMQIGNHVAIDDYLYCTTQLIVGDYCHISAHVSIVGGASAVLTMGDFSHLAAGARLIVFGDENLGAGLVSPVIPMQYRDRMVGGNITIGNFVSVLTNAIVAPGVILGDGCLLAAGGFAKHDIPEWEIWGGVPAKFIKRRDKGRMIEYARKLGYDYD